MVCELCKVLECICKSKSFSLKPLKYVEDLMEKLTWHCCCHFKHGCQDIFDAKGLDYHQKSCIYREINCISEDCKKKVLFKDFFDHVEACHQDLNNASKMDEKSFIVSFDSSDGATLRLEVPNFPELSENTFSKPIYFQNIPWMLYVRPTFSNDIKYLGCFVNCDFQSNDKNRSCQAKAELRLINHKDPKKTLKRITSHLYIINVAHGWPQYMLWTDVTDPEAGFLKDNTVTFEAKLVADPPIGM